MTLWPQWWSWELELSPHLLKRMIDRQFAETDLRQMLEDATGFQPDHELGRWIIQTRHAGLPWEVVVEPIEGEQLLVVVTAYCVSIKG